MRTFFTSPTKSRVAGIIDVWGGLRVIVAKKFGAHVARGEHLFVVPRLRVREPVEWDTIPFIVHSVQRHIAEHIRGINDQDAMAEPLRLYEIRCMRSKPLRTLDTSTIVWG
jgi:hypothetical protein